MNIHEYRWNLMNSTLSYRGKMVGVVLAQHCKDGRYFCYPSFQTLVELTGFGSKSTVQKGLAELDGLFIRIEKKYKNIYHLIEDYKDKLSTGGVPSDGTGVVPSYNKDGTLNGTHLDKDGTLDGTPNGTTVVQEVVKKESSKEVVNIIYTDSHYKYEGGQKLIDNQIYYWDGSCYQLYKMKRY